MGEKRVVESFAKQFASFRPLAQQTRANAHNRMVWFVALCGFVILNGKTLWDSIAQAHFSGLPLALLVSPWVIAALFAVITHFTIDEVEAKDNIYFVQKAAAIDLYLEGLEENTADPREMLAIINDTAEDLKESRHNVDRYQRLAERLERITFIFIVIGFIWSVIGPFLLVYIIKTTSY